MISGQPRRPYGVDFIGPGGFEHGPMSPMH